MIAASEFKALVGAVRSQLVRYVGRLAGPADAEDIVQIVLAKAVSALGEFRGDSSPRTWLFRIATNAARDWNRARRVPGRELVELGAEEPEGADDAEDAGPERRLVREEMSHCVGEVLGRLPESYRIALALADCDELSDRELAGVLGVSVGAAKIRLHRARAKMKEELETECSFYRNPDNVLCCDRKQKSVAALYPSSVEPRLELRSRQTDGESQTRNEDFMTSSDTLPAKQKELISVGAAIAAGCEPCTTAHVQAAREAGACERGVRFAIEGGLKGRELALAAISAFADESFAHPQLDADFRAERILLDALITVAAAVSANAARSVRAAVDAARSLGATDDQIRLAAQIARAVKRGAEKEAEATLSAALGDPVSPGCCTDACVEAAVQTPVTDRSSACGCGEKTANKT